MAHPSLYLLPGLLCDASVWTHQTESLHGVWEIHVPELFRFRSLGAMAEHVLSAAPQRFALAGHSLGGRVALEIVRRAPERISGLALLDTGVHPVQPDEAEKRKAMLQLARTEGMAALAERWLPPMVHPDLPRDGALMTGLKAMVMRRTPDEFENQVVALLTRPDAAPVLRGIRCPLLLGVGRQDSWSPLAQHEEMAAAVPHARLVVFEHSGHMATLEAPHAVSDALGLWLTP